MKCAVILLGVSIFAPYVRAQDGETPDRQLFRQLTARAADGDIDAMAELGSAYYDGRGTPQDYNQAAYWLSESAQYAEPKAMLLLGALYRLGRGVPRDYVKAHMWLNLAASHVSGNLRKEYAALRDKAAEVMTPEQIQTAQILAGQWAPKPLPKQPTVKSQSTGELL